MRDGNISEERHNKRYFNCLEYFNSMNFEKMCQNFTLSVMVEGAYYGLLRESNEGVGIQKLPFEYCRTRFQSLEGIDIVELNLEYFDNIREEALRVECLKTFPRDVKTAYNAFKNKNATKWFSFPVGTGVYFSLYEERPFMLNIIPAILDFNEYREIEKEKDKQELKKILVNKLPITSDGELVFDPDEAVEMHRGLVGMLKKCPSVDVLTSYGTVSLEDLQENRQAISNNLEKIEKTIYSESGVSKQVFSADGNLSLEKSINNDMALMMYLANSYSNWLTYILNTRFGNGKITFSAKILPVSYYNADDYISKTLNMAQYGYGFLVPSIALGIDQSEIQDLKTLEIDLLNLDVKLVPLVSSHTQNGEGGSTTPAKDLEKKPNNEKSQAKKSDRTLENEKSKDGG
jgi:hypothetical protein